jgi:hypothetical protein
MIDHHLLLILIGLGLFCLLTLDIYLSKCFINIYQLILIYFFLTIASKAVFINSSYPLYSFGLYIFLVHCFFFIIGYNSLSYRIQYISLYKKSNKLFILLICILLLIKSIQIIGLNASYSDRFLNKSEIINYFNLFINNAFFIILLLIIFLKLNIITASLIFLFYGFLNFIELGVKGLILQPLLVLVTVLQVNVFKYKIKILYGLLFLSIILFSIAINSFRSELGFGGLFYAITEIDSYIPSLMYFFISPELLHIEYLDILAEAISNNHIDFRFGFDYWRFIIVGLSNSSQDIELASYNEFPKAIFNSSLNQGIYIGLAGELYWNFGPLFLFFSYISGLLLKFYLNWSYSGNKINFIIYLISIKPILWFLYRGEGNALVIWFITLFFSVFLIALYKSILSKKLWQK